MSATPHLRWRRMRRRLSQAIVLGTALLALIGLGLLVRQGFAERGVSFSFDFLIKRAGFEISEGFAPTASGLAPFTSDMSNWQALATGLFNTLKVAIVATVLATVIGVTLGVSRLSGNWVVRNLAFWITEFVRNTPLLIQLTFWYVAVVLKLPGLRDAPQLWGMIISQQGFWFPRPSVTGGPESWLVLAALVAAVLAVPTGPVLRRRVLAGLAAFLLALALALGFHIGFETPEVGRFRASGGIVVSPEYAALLMALTVNTAAYLGEIVRGAIEALPRGQWEAADSIGLSRRYVLGDVVLPQVFRVVLPAFGNQYISLAKNTSLGIAIGFPDLFNVYGTVANQSGRTLEGILVAMAIYLLLSWLISLMVNLANRRLKIPGVR